MSGNGPEGTRTGRAGLARVFPILDWGRRYSPGIFTSDLVAAVIVTIMLIPQSLAYAILAGMPPETGLYASILPLLAYTVFGASAELAVGPMAVTSLLTAAAVGRLAPAGSEAYVGGAIVLAILSGLVLAAMGVLRLGFIATFLSRPVVSGFITASSLLIAMSQIGTLIGTKVAGQTLPEQVVSLAHNIGGIDLVTIAIGLASLGFLQLVRRYGKSVLRRLKVPGADLIARAGPVGAVALASLAVWGLGLDRYGVAIVGTIPEGLPPITLPPLDPVLWGQLAGPAVLLALIGFVGSISVAQTFAARKRERVDANQELIGLGAANIAAGLSGGFPVTGGLSRSAVMVQAGALTPACGALTAVGIALATLFLTPLLYYLPTATLAATIIIAVLSLVETDILKRTWVYSKTDFAAVAVTIAATLLLGVELGIIAGVGLSLVLFLYRTTRPHMAIVGLVPGTEHFRNVNRHAVVTSPAILSIRIDESLYFANARTLEEAITDRVAADPAIRHVILMCSAVNEIDASALESLEAINARLKAAGVSFNLSEVKGPVMDRLKRTDFLNALTGRVFLSQYEAATALDPSLAGGRTATPATAPVSAAAG